MTIFWLLPPCQKGSLKHKEADLGTVPT
jgi:hypothetical protein